MDLHAWSTKLQTLCAAPVARRDLERLLAAVQRFENPWTLLGASGVPAAVLTRALRLLCEEGVLALDDRGVSLTPAGRRIVRDLRISPPPLFACGRCSGRGLDTRLGDLEAVRRRFVRWAGHKRRPEPCRAYNQGCLTVESVLARVASIWARGDLEGKDLLVLGDDDLVSLAAGLTGAPERVVVLELDGRLVHFLEEARDAEGLSASALEVRRHDLRRPLPSDLLGRFDTFLTDPPEDFLGLRAFLWRGLSALKGEGGAGYFGLTRVEASLRKWHRLQGWLHAQGACLTEVIPDFSTYENWAYFHEMRAWRWFPLPAPIEPEGEWYRSSWHRIEVIRGEGEGKEYGNPSFVGETWDDEEEATT